LPRQGWNRKGEEGESDSGEHGFAAKHIHHIANGAAAGRLQCVK
jgi:hypothetical protein